MSARLGYPLPSSNPNAGAECDPAGVGLQGLVDTTDIAGATTDPLADEQAGTWLGHLRPNKYSGAVDPETETEEALRIAAAAGLPPVSRAQLAEAEAAVQNDPRFDELKEALGAAPLDPEGAKKRGWKIMQSMLLHRQRDNNDIWAVLVLALRHALLDQGEQLRYNLQRLEMYGAIARQMSKYGAVLQDAQRRLDVKLSQEKDDLKRSFVEVPLGDQREYDAQSFFALEQDGGVHYIQHAKQAEAVAPQALEAIDADPYLPLWKFGFGKPQQGFKSAAGAKYVGKGRDEEARRADASKHLSDKNQSEADAANVVSTTGLGLKVQNYTQQREQLQKLTEKWQTRFQMDHEIKNQTASAITSVLKNLHDMQAAITRNMQ